MSAEDLWKELVRVAAEDKPVRLTLHVELWTALDWYSKRSTAARAEVEHFCEKLVKKLMDSSL